MPQPPPTSRSRSGSFKHAVALVAAALASDVRPQAPWLRTRIQRLADRGLRWMDARREQRDRETLGE